MMKTKNLWCRAVGLAVAMWTSAGAAETAAGAVAAERVGIYDSRAVAYAHFWSADAQRSRNEVIAAGKAAKAAGDTAVFEAKSRMMADYQKRMHDQVFSSAPATDAMAALAARMPTLLGEIGVARLVSKWDEKALKAVPAEKRVDVTEKLVREFITPNEKQQKVLDSMKTTEPVPRWKMSLLKIFSRG
jgi:hypothetical protein